MRMLRKWVFLVIATVLAMLLTSSRAHAWGAYHVGFTHVGAGGIYHYGRTAAVGPYGAYSGAHYGAYGERYGGLYGERSGYGYHYSSPSYYGGYHYGGMTTGDFYGGYRGGYYRAW
jgi:hypothetical protein